MSNLIENLILIQFDTNSLLVNVKWMLLWPILSLQFFLMWRTVKSFAKK